MHHMSSTDNNKVNLEFCLNQSQSHHLEILNTSLCGRFYLQTEKIIFENENPTEVFKELPHSSQIMQIVDIS